MSGLFPFTASNGWSIREGVHGLEIHDDLGENTLRDYSHLIPEEMQTLREFFQAERDAELGRWRSKEDDGYVVYRDREGVTVLDESDGRSEWISDDIQGTSAFHEVAAEFFVSHFESKPWDDAKPGEVWALKCAGLEFPAILRGDVWIATDHGGRVLAENITAGRRIWPEGGDDQ